MNKVTKRIFGAVMALVMILSIETIPVSAAETVNVPEKSTVTMTVERITIGQGFLVSPTQVEVSEGDTVATVFEKVMALKGITFLSADGGYGFYLNSINNADTGILNIPAEISAMPDVTLWYGSIAKAPTNDVNDGNFYENKGLGTASYNSMSGWMFIVNNEDLGMGADSVSVKAGDVIRWQFSVYGYGADIGFDMTSYTGIPLVELANKDALIKEVAVVSDNAEMLKDSAVKAAYNSAITVLEKYNPLQSEISAALTQLQTAEKTYTDSTNKQDVTVARATIKSVKNVKGYKAKISVKKIKSVAGYQYKYANNKKLKNATVKSTTKSTLTTKKFKKKQRCYVKVRVYKKVKGVKYYGKWSIMKSVKIKK
jgi:hypothetical protein